MQKHSNYTESIFMQSRLWHKEIVIMQRDNYYSDTESHLLPGYHTESQLLCSPLLH